LSACTVQCLARRRMHRSWNLQRGTEEDKFMALVKQVSMVALDNIMRRRKIPLAAKPNFGCDVDAEKSQKQCRLTEGYMGAEIEDTIEI